MLQVLDVLDVKGGFVLCDTVREFLVCNDCATSPSQERRCSGVDRETMYGGDGRNEDPNRGLYLVPYFVPCTRSVVVAVPTVSGRVRVGRAVRSILYVY